MYGLLSCLFSIVYVSYVLIIILNVIKIYIFYFKKEKIINMIVINKIKEWIYNYFILR